MKRTLLILTVVAIPFLLLFSIIGIYFSKHTIVAPKEVRIPHGSSANSIAEVLYENDIIVSTSVFRIAVRTRGDGLKMQSGVYRFPSPVSIHDVLNILVAGTYRMNKLLTVREGWTSKMIAGLLREECHIDSSGFMRLVHDRQFIASLGIDARSLEGYLMPETYILPEKHGAKDILRMMISTFRKKITPDMRLRMNQMHKSEKEILTMASIVEGETAIDSERKIVAGVYYNRLKQGLKLQADPTIQYIISDSPRRLYFKDLEIDSPYNTYKHKGLPPTPINNPGIASIMAALYPANHKFFYFVADGSGGHIFSMTEKQHLIAVQKYRALQNRMK